MVKDYSLVQITKNTPEGKRTNVPFYRKIWQIQKGIGYNYSSGPKLYQDIPDGEIILQIIATELEYKFSVQKPGTANELVASAFTKNLPTEITGGFTGVFIGIYASGDGSVNTHPADFDWFDFTFQTKTSKLITGQAEGENGPEAMLFKACP